MRDGQTTAPEPDTVQLMEQFRAIAHVSHNRTNARMNAAGLSLARFRVLQALASGGRLRMNELSAALGVVPRTVTTIIDALEKDRMVARLADPADRRATLLEITEEGLSLLRRLRALRDAAAAELFEVLTPAEKQQLARLLRRLQAAADDRGIDAFGPQAPLKVTGIAAADGDQQATRGLRVGEHPAPGGSHRR
jgi:DNA-binding MarR family transcriptional regulator